MLNHCYMNVIYIYDCYMVLFLWRYHMSSLNYVEFHLLVLRKKWAYDAEVESPGVYNLGSSIKRWPTRGGGQQKCLDEKTVLNCFKEPLFSSFWMTNIFFWGGQLLGESLMANPYTIHNSKKNIDLEFPYWIYIHLQQNNNHKHKSMWRGGEDDGESWWWMMMGCHRQTKTNDQKAFDLISHCHIMYKWYICGPWMGNQEIHSSQSITVGYLFLERMELRNNMNNIEHV